MQKRSIANLIAIFVLLLTFFAAEAKAEGEFNPNYIIGDDEVLNHNSMTFQEIDSFLKSKDGYLANYKCANPDGLMMSAAEVIYDRAVTNKVNPKFLLVLLQKEQSLIEKKDPTQTQLDWAVGYGCFDNQPCNTRWQGFWKQVNSASLQFRDYMDNPQLYNYKPNQTYTLTNSGGREPSIVTPLNRATSALYNYTPHVYFGNYNFFTIWQRYFGLASVKPVPSYPNGSLLQVEGEVGVWLIQDGMKRPFLTKGALTSRYDIRRIIKVSRSEIDRYPKGAPIKFAQYSLVQDPKGAIYLIVDDQKRKIASDVAFRQIGFNPEEIISGSWDDINAYKNGEPVSATSTHLTGALLQNNKTGGVYWVIDGTKSPLLDAVLLKTKFKNRKITAVAPAQLDAYKTVPPIIFGDGEILKSSISTSVFIIADGKKMPVTSGKVFEGLGYRWENIITVSPKLLYQYAEGKPLDESLISNTQTASGSQPATATLTSI